MEYFKNDFMLRISLLIFFTIVSSLVHSEELELNCKFDNYNATNRAYTKRVIKSWAPELQKHLIKSDTTSYWNEARIEGKVEVNNSEKIKIKYILKTKYITHYTFLFFKTTKKATIYMDFPGYVPPGDIWGSCNERKINQKKSIQNSDLNDENLDNISDKLICYRYGLYNGKYIKEAQRRKLNCKSKDNEKTDTKNKINNKTREAEKKCKELGFTPATESYGSCVLKLID